MSLMQIDMIQEAARTSDLRDDIDKRETGTITHQTDPIALGLTDPDRRCHPTTPNDQQETGVLHEVSALTEHQEIAAGVQLLATDPGTTAHPIEPSDHLEVLV